MGLFRYEAVDNAGKVVHGVMDAASEQHVTRKLETMGYSARAVYTANGQPATSNRTAIPTAVAQPTAPRASGGIAKVTLPNGVPISIKSLVSASVLARFFRQLAMLVRSGQPMYESLMHVSVSNRGIRAALPVMRERIQSGQKLSSAMAEFPDLFPVHAIASVWCGELAGKLDVVIDEIATDFEQEAKDTLWGKVGWGITKLGVLTTILGLALSNMQPLVDKLTAAPATGVSDNPTAIPSVSGDMLMRTLGAVFQFIMYGFIRALPFLIGVIVLWYVWGHIKRIPTVRYALDVALLKTLTWGKLHRYASLARFLHLMDSVTAAGIYPTTAWDAASLAVRNSDIASRLKLARGTAPPSAGVRALLQASGVFDMDDIGMVQAGESAGQMQEALSNLASIYSDKLASQRTLGRISSIGWIVVSQTIFTGVMLIIEASQIATTFNNFTHSLFKGLGI